MGPRSSDTLEQLILAIAVLNGLHALDHVVRGDFHWPIDEQSIGFIVVIAAISLVLGLGLIGYRRRVIGPRFWAVIGLGGLSFGWLSHFSPFTDQPLSAIFHAYHSVLAGGVAVGILVVLMMTVLLATIQALVRWGTSVREHTPSPL